MSIKNTLFLSLITLILSSCSSNTYYQVYHTKAVGELMPKENALVYEDENCKILYNLWGEGGNIGFQFYNKTNEPLTIHLDKSFFILNDVAYDYFKERVITHSSSAGTSASKKSGGMVSMTGWNALNLLQTNSASIGNSIESSVTAGESVAYQEKRTVTIPSKTSKIISEYSINNSVLRDCDLFLYPNKRQIKSLNYTAETSPLKFSNRISYSLPNSNEPLKVENSFHVSEISNYPKNEITKTSYEEYCGEKSRIEETRFIDVAPNKFYVKYTKNQNSDLKH